MNQIPGAITDSTTVPTSLPEPGQAAHLPARSSPAQLKVLPMPVVYAISASSGSTGAITATQGSENLSPAPETASNPFYRPVPRGFTPLGQAAYTGDLEQVQALIQQGCKTDVFETGAGDGYTPLLAAAENGHTGIVEALLKAGADVNLKNGNFGDTALIRAAERGHQDVVSLLLQQKGIRIDEARRHGESAFCCAAINSHAVVAEMLLDKSVVTSKVRNQLMVSACCSGKLAIVKLLHLRGGIDLAELQAHECLHIAATSRQTEVVAYLLGAGMDAHATDRRGRSPLQSACWGGSVPVVDLLMAHAAVDSSATASVLTQPLQYIAAAGGYLELLDYLLKPGVDSNLRDIGSGLTPLMAAACTGRVDIMRSLLACPGLEIDLVCPNPRAKLNNSAECTALELAISENKRDAAVCLLKAGAKVAWPTEPGYRNSVLGWAITHRDCDMVRLVLERCAASFGQGNVRCDAAMKQAVEARCTDIVECLVEAGHAVAVPD